MRSKPLVSPAPTPTRSLEVSVEHSGRIKDSRRRAQPVEAERTNRTTDDADARVSFLASQRSPACDKSV